VLDLGCGHGTIAEPLRDLGLTYVGLDISADSVQDLRQRGFEADTVDLSDPGQLDLLVEKYLDGRPMAACTLVDFLEHLADGPAILAALRQTSIGQAMAPVVVSVTNVTHIDIAAKLLLGRFDYTKDGLLDRNHAVFYSPALLDEVFRGAGWQEVGRRDFELNRSDQHYPSDAAAIVRGTPLNNLLLQVRQRAGEGALVAQFVRAYAPLEGTRLVEEPEFDPPFLSVLVRTQGKRPNTIVENLLSLAAQTVQDFEVLVLAHDMTEDQFVALRESVEMFDPTFTTRVRIVRVEGGGRAHPLNVGVLEARGTYVAALDDDDIAFAHWVETFQRAASAKPGTVVRAMVAEQQIEPAPWGAMLGYTTTSAISLEFPERFDFWEHLWENQSPFCGIAFPRSCFTVMGVRFDEALPVVEDWDAMMQAALLCGVTDAGEVTSLYRRWQSADSSLATHRQDEWNRSRDVVLARIDGQTLPLPPGTLSDYHRLHESLKKRIELIELLVLERDAAREESSGRQERIDELFEEMRTVREELHSTGTERNLSIELAQRQQDEIERIKRSVSWKLLQPLRSLRSLSGRMRGRRSSR
jgi:glycosyltransferase involved in cell wall biosynthesis